MNNSPPDDRVESWHWQLPKPLLPQAGDDPAGPDIVEPLQRPFDLDQHWERGGFPVSLFAPEVRIRNEYLDRYIASLVTRIPKERRSGKAIDGIAFFKAMARFNGRPLESLRLNRQLDRETFAEIIGILRDADVIETLPFLPNDGRSLYYFRDTGVLHRLFNPKWNLNGKHRQHRDRSWEGFVVQTIRHGPGNGAEASVWRLNDDEIDLIIDWPNSSEKWAIEIGSSEDKRPSPGFWIGVEILKPTLYCVVHRGETDTVEKNVIVSRWRRFSPRCSEKNCLNLDRSRLTRATLFQGLGILDYRMLLSVYCMDEV